MGTECSSRACTAHQLSKRFWWAWNLKLPFLVEDSSGDVTASQSIGESLLEGSLSVDINSGQLYVANSKV